MKNIKDLLVVLGESNENVSMPVGTIEHYYKIESVVIHYGYDPYIPLNDIAVIRLKSQFSLYQVKLK